MSARPAKVCDWADQAALDLLPHTQLMPGNTIADITNAIAVALRQARNAGYAEAKYDRPTLMELAARRTPQMDAELREYAIGLGQRTRLAPRDIRQRLYELRRTIRDFDTQSDHDIERTEGWAAGEGAL